MPESIDIVGNISRSLNDATLKFLDMQKKNDFELLRKFLLLEEGKTLWTKVGKKSEPF